LIKRKLKLLWMKDISSEEGIVVNKMELYTSDGCHGDVVLKCIETGIPM
jgi:hypothetical protein